MHKQKTTLVYFEVTTLSTYLPKPNQNYKLPKSDRFLAVNILFKLQSRKLLLAPQKQLKCLTNI